MDVQTIVIESNWHRQTAIDKLVAAGMDYSAAGQAVDEVFNRYSLASDDDDY